MAFYLSPLVDVNEIDLTTTIPAVATSIAVTVLRNTYKGPERKKQLITSTNGLIDIFGKPTTDASCYQDILSAAGFLRYGSALYCTRTMPTSATFAGTMAASGGAAYSFTAYTTGNAYKLTDFDSEDPNEFGNEITVSGIYPFYLIAASRGAWGNNIRVACADYSTYNAIASGGNRSWDTYSVLHGVDSPLLDTRDFLIVVQVISQGDEVKEANWKTVEVWNVSTDQNRVDDQGQKKYAEMIINEASNYIRISMNENALDQAINIATSAWQTFAGGQDDNGDTVTDGQIELDFDLYANPDEIDVNIFIDSNKSTTVKSYLVSIAETRKDSMAILDCISTDVINNKGGETEALRVYRRDTLNENTSYASLYGNWIEVYDKWNGRYRWIPASGYVAGVYANTDDVSDPWFAPAGLNRALLGNIRKLAWNPTKSDRDILYKNGINPIVSFAGQGKSVWGQKTLLDKESAFNRINVGVKLFNLESTLSH